jgi:hypothetical protein
MSHNSKYYVKKLLKRDGSKSMRLELFGFKKKFLMNNASNCNESSESERAQSSQRFTGHFYFACWIWEFGVKIW